MALDLNHTISSPDAFVRHRGKKKLEFQEGRDQCRGTDEVRDECATMDKKWDKRGRVRHRKLVGLPIVQEARPGESDTRCRRERQNRGHTQSSLFSAAGFSASAAGGSSTSFGALSLWRAALVAFASLNFSLNCSASIVGSGVASVSNVRMICQTTDSRCWENGWRGFRW